jgi:phosphoenolpyruvate synthase/pyruvate phosphate dikinase
VASADLIIDLKSHYLPATEQIGGKARNLMLLRKYGLPVPPGFCLDCAAYEQHINERLSVPLSDALKGLARAKKADRSMILVGIRRQILEPAIDPRLAEELLQYYMTLKAPLMAVRSSATAEDQERLSFAGQYETILNVSSFEGLQSTIKKCWASLWNERAYEYCRKNNINWASLKMAVIVQRQVAADFAGVVFTVDPATGSRNKLVIEYCAGLGDKLVSGRIAPRRVSVDKALHLFSSGGVSREAMAASGSLDPGTIKMIARWSVRIEKKFGCPQDIEWAVAGKKIFFLQTRPVTTARAESSWEDRQIWTNANTGEVLPDVVTPLTWTVVMPFVKCIFDSFLGIVGAELGDVVLFNRIAGRAYFNLNTLAGILRSIPGFQKFDITRVFGGAQGSMGDMGSLTIADEDIPVIRFKVSCAFLFLPLRTLQLLAFNPETAIKDLENIKANIERLYKYDLAGLSDDGLFNLWHKVSDKIYSTIHQSGFLALAMMYYTNLDKLCQKWFKGRPGEHTNQLLAGIGDIEPAKAGLALYELSRTARQYPVLLRNISGRQNWQALRPRISRVKGGREFLDAWQDFMIRYGHHTRSEIELMNPRWSESSDFVLGMIRNYLITSDTDGCPIEHYDHVTERRVKLTADLRAKLKNPVNRFIFNYYLRKAQQGSVIRENLKNMWMKAWFVIRRIILEFGDRLHQRRIISKVDDIFFLRIEEIGPLLKGSPRSGFRGLIKERRREYEQDRTISPPKVIMGSFDPKHFVPDPVTPAKTLLTGLAVSPGVVRGKARVIIDTKCKERVKSGEILVAPFTDPGWTPYFMTAAAIVVDMGGLLSHGSIVAREYGIPAVVNVGPATKIIRTGQMLEVDGDQGIVRIID